MAFKRIRTYLYTCLAILLAGTGGLAQGISGYAWPIDSTFVITGNYGELRPNHFHAGVDFSTGGKINLPVYSIEEGYVSRIRVSPYGYGKCIYITHPGGRVSVYAHLNKFSLKIDKVVRAFQYDTQSNEIDYMLRPRTVYVRKNEIIGLSGNTGGSTGPHLHFEIRDEKTEVPLNPLAFFRIKDQSPPELKAIALFDLSDTTAPRFLGPIQVKESRKDSFVLLNDRLVLQTSHAGLSFSGLDRVLPGGNANNIHAAYVYADDILIYSHAMKGIAFADSRFINAFTEPSGRNRFQKCFLPENYPEGLFGKCLDKGRLHLDDQVFRKIKLVVYDESGNRACLQFYLKAARKTPYRAASARGDIYVSCLKPLSVSRNKTSLTIPARTLFYSTALSVKNTVAEDGRLSVLPAVSLKQAVTLGFKVPAPLLRYRDKLLLKGTGAAALPVNRNDSVSFQVKEFGNFQLILDTVAPVIRLARPGQALKETGKMNELSFLIRDSGSGIGKYNLWLNKTWVVCEYDAGKQTLSYYFDEETPGGLLHFTLEVEDKVGNASVLEYTLKR